MSITSAGQDRGDAFSQKGVFSLVFSSDQTVTAPFSLIDMMSASHTFQVNATHMLLDGCLVERLECQPDRVELYLETGEMLSCTPDALWEAFAGADSPPTIQEGGYWFVMALTQTLKNQQFTLWESQVRELFSDLPRLSNPFVELELPGQREHFAPFIEDFLLHKCTGAREELEVIAGLGNI